MGLADLHIHSIYSKDGTGTIPAILKYVADKTELNVVAITDHDSMVGVAEAKQRAANYGLEVVPGCEVSTEEGHLLALFINSPVRQGNSLIDTVLMIADQGGIAIAPHPMVCGTSSLSIKTIEKALAYPGVADCLVGVELFNGGPEIMRNKAQIVQQIKQLPLAMMGNSDAHVLPLIGHGATWFEGQTAKDLKRAVLTGKTEPQFSSGLGTVDILKTYLPRYFLKQLGWAAWNENPKEKIRYIRYQKVIHRHTAGIRA